MDVGHFTDDFVAVVIDAAMREVVGGDCDIEGLDIAVDVGE